MKISPKISAAFAALLLAAAALSSPALARDSYVIDGAGMLSASTVSALNAKISDFNRATGKEVVVVTMPSLNGTSLSDATEHTFAEKQINGVLILISKGDKKFIVAGDRASRAFFPPGTFQTIHDAMRASFQSGDFDGGVTTGVNLVLAQYRSHLPAGGTGAVQQRAPATSNQSFGGFMSLIWLGLILLAGFLIIRAIFRAIFGRRMQPPGYGPGPGYGQPPMMGGPGYGGYGGGYGGGGGGSFFSGLLGGLGGAFLGNELFRGGQNFGGGAGAAGIGGADAPVDAGGWQSDAGQVDMGNAGSGGWGDSGGGFDAGGGGFDGGGGGDGGGGW